MTYPTIQRQAFNLMLALIVLATSSLCAQERSQKPAVQLLRPQPIKPTLSPSQTGTTIDTGNPEQLFERGQSSNHGQSFSNTSTRVSSGNSTTNPQSSQLLLRDVVPPGTLAAPSVAQSSGPPSFEFTSEVRGVEPNNPAADASDGLTLDSSSAGNAQPVEHRGASQVNDMSTQPVELPSLQFFGDGGLPFPMVPTQPTGGALAIQPALSSDRQAMLPQHQTNAQPETITPMTAPLTDYVPDELEWWEDELRQPLLQLEASRPIDVPTLFAMTAQYSGRVQAIRQAPWISGTRVDQALAAFDPVFQGVTRFDSVNDPVKNTLTTGGPPRLEQYIWGMTSGVRGQTYSGATYGVEQRFGHENSNSTFFTPNNQGTARLVATVNQPLLRGRDIDLNRSLILTARFETDAARAEYLEILQEQLRFVADAYWSLYYERATLLQRQRHLQRAIAIADLMKNRQSYDSIQSQVLRVQAAVKNRTAELVASEANIRNIQAQLQALVNSPELAARIHEFLPNQRASLMPVEFDIQSEVGIAIQRRPEIQAINDQIQATRVRLTLAHNQTKPLLNFIAEGYVAGLEGNSNVFGAWASQFADNRPGYAGGFEFEMPYRNRQATSEMRQRRHELSQLDFLLKEQMANVEAEVETAIRNVEATYQAALSRRDSLAALNAEVSYLEDRWRSLRGDPSLGRLQLEDLLSAHVRLLQEEQALLTAAVDYNRAIIEVQRATGALVQLAP